MDLDKGIKKALDIGADFCDIRSGEASVSQIVVRNGAVDRVKCGTEKEFSVRVIYKGGMGFVSSNKASDLENAVVQAFRLAKASKENLSISLADAPVVVDKLKRPFKINPQDVPVEEKVRDLKEIENRKPKRGIVSTDLTYADSSGDYSYHNTDGTEIEIFDVGTIIYAVAYSKAGALQTGYEVEGSLEGYELVSRNNGIMKRACDKAHRLSKAAVSPSGKFTVITDHNMTGVLAHEAIGHACEADYVLRDASVLNKLRGHEIADQLVTIVDDPTLNALFGSYFYDSEGVRSGRTVLVQNGILRGYLHSRHTAELMGDEPTGNARANVGERPIVRMGNTFFDTGDFSEEEIMDVDYGILAKGMKGGSVTTEDGNFQFSCEEGYIIRGGEVTDCIRDLNIVGNILDFLKNVDAIGSEVKFNAGMCGKDGKLIPVSSGGPMIRIKDVVVGGR